MSGGLALGFEVEWFDPVSRLLRTLYLRYFLDDNTIELLQEKSFLLKRIFYGDVTVQDLFVGNSVTIYDRLLLIKNYANVATERYMSARETHLLVTVPSDSLTKVLPRLFARAKLNKLIMGKVKSLDNGMTAIEFVFHKKIGASNADNVDDIIEQLVGSGSSDVDVRVASRDDIRDTFSQSITPVTDNPDCSICIIKPHVLKSQRVADLLQSIATYDRYKFNIESICSFHFSKVIADEFLEVYREVYPSYTQMLDHITSSQVLVLVITGSDDYVVEEFRALCGPLNPEIARRLRPFSLRAQYGEEDFAHNAVHCTDLREDGPMECRFVMDFIGRL